MRQVRLTTFGQLVRFVVVGVTNTLATGAIFLAISAWLVPAAAYTIAFAIGVAFAVAVTPRLVFSARGSLRGRALYATWYLVVYLAGLVAVYGVHDVLGLDRLAIVAVTVPTTAALGFVGARTLFHVPGEA